MMPCAEVFIVVDALQHPPRDEQRPNRRRARRRRPARSRARAPSPRRCARGRRGHGRSGAGSRRAGHRRRPAPRRLSLGAGRRGRRIGTKPGAQQHSGGNLLDIAGERLADRVGEQIERGAGLARARLDDGAEPPYAAVVDIVSIRPLASASMVCAISLSTTETTCQAMKVSTMPAPTALSSEDRQREAKSGGAEELTERRHGSCIRRRGRC